MDSRKIFISTIGQLLVVIISIIASYVLRIFFSVEQIGIYGAIIAYFVTFGFFTELGFTLAHLKHFPEAKSPEEEAKYIGTLLFFRFIQISAFIIVSLVFIPIMQVYPDDILLVFGFLLIELIMKSNLIFRPIFLSRKKVVKLSISNLLINLIKLILMLLLTQISTDLRMLFWIYFSSSVCYFITNLFFLRGIKIQKPSKELIIKYFKYAYPYFITSSLQIIISNIDILFVNFWFPKEDVGNYYTAKQIYYYMAIFVNNISDILINTFSKNINMGNEDENLELINKIHKFLGLFIIPTVFLVNLYATRILIFIFGVDYQLTGIILGILVINFIQISVGTGISIQLKSLAETKYLAWTTLFRHIVAILLQIFFITPYFLNGGAIGGAWAFAIVGILMVIIIRPITYKKYGLGLYWGVFRYLIIMGGISILQLYINHVFYYNIIFVPVFAMMDILLFLGILYITKGISKSDIKFIFQIVNIKEIKKLFFYEISEEWD